MKQYNVVVDSEMVYPILFLPKNSTTLETNCEITDNVFIDMKITTLDCESEETQIYSGFCNVKLVDSYGVNHFTESSQNDMVSLVSNDIDQMPVILAEENQLSFPVDNQSQVWIDPSRSPFVYNNYDSLSHEDFSIHGSRNCITVEQHNTYITQNVYKYKESNVFDYRAHQPSTSNEFEHNKFGKVTETATNHHDSNWNLYDEAEFECGVFLSQLPEEIINEKLSKAREEHRYVGYQYEDNALKQLMSTDIQSMSKQRKTILFLGRDSKSGETIQNISYSDPLVNCADFVVDNEVIIEDSPKPKEKKYQCDKCKQIFNKMSAFHRHTVSGHTNYQTQQDKEISFICIECGKNFKSQSKFEKHCVGHGDPELECSKCHKVYSSKFTLRTHQKVHKRKFPCTYCVRKTGFSTEKMLNKHLRKVHFVFKCEYGSCSYTTNAGFLLECHHKTHIINNKQSETYADSYMDDVTEEEFETDIITMGDPDHNLKSEKFEHIEVTDSAEEKIKREKIKKADSVIAKVVSNKIFLLNPKNARKYRPYHKTCDVCYKPFDRISDLKRHLIEHVVKSTLSKSPVTKNGALNIVCQVCRAETFAKTEKYKAHLREHAKLTQYKCTFCDKSFSDSSNFSKHKKIHGDSHFQCDLCQRKFNSKKTITQHMEYHSKHEPIKCRVCSQLFHFESTLNKHMKNVHKTKASQIKYKCILCDAFFTALRNKWEHEWVVHNVRKMIVDCLICGGKFRKYSELKKHCLDLHSLNISSKKFFKKHR